LLAADLPFRHLIPWRRCAATPMRFAAVRVRAEHFTSLAAGLTITEVEFIVI
jgi:hypothetical protein